MYPDAGVPWAPSKHYETGWTRRRIEAMNAACVARGIESPFADWFKDGGGRALPPHDDRFTTLIDVGDFLDVRRRALLAHRTQVDPEGFWMQIPDDLVREVYPWEEYALVASTVPGAAIPPVSESDLFEGVRRL